MRAILTFFLFLLTSGPALAVEFKFADAEKAREIVLAQDAYFSKMGSAEIALRLESETADKTVDDLKAEFFAEVRDWNPEAKAAVEQVIADHAGAINRVAHLLPETVWLIQTSPKFGGGLPHTLGNAIIIHETYNPTSAPLFFHELFHVLSRSNPDKHAGLYGLLGFQACRLNEPASMAERHLINPDEPLDLDYYVSLATGEGDKNFMPYLYSAHPAFNPEIEGGFPAHFGFGLLELDVADGVCTPVMNADGAPVLKSPGEVPSFFEAIGRNTGYIIHPEETISDNFVILLLGWTGENPIPNPEIPERIGAWIDAQR